MNTAIHIKSFRKTALIAAILISLAVCVALALFQTRSVLTGNTISTASADLLVSTDGISYSRSIAGFSFDDIIPGGYPAPIDGYTVYLKNAGSTPVSLQLTIDNIPSNSGTADLGAINFALTDTSGSTAPRDFVLQSLISDTQPIEGELASGAVREYKLQVLASEVATPGVTVGDINLGFIGTAHDPNDPN